MEITWLGHSCVCINSRDVFLIADPYDTSEGEFMSPRKADIVSMSNASPKHSNMSSVTGSPRIIDGPGEYEISHFYIKGLGTAINEQDEPGGPINTIYTIRAEGLVISHLGGLTQKLTPAQMDSLRQTQILVTPVAGSDSLQASTIQEIISTIQPRILLLVGHGTGQVDGLPTPNAFLTEIGVADIPEPSIRLNVTETNLPAEMQVQLLRRQT
mgnify:FL=1